MCIYTSRLAFTGVVQIHVSMKAGASSPGMTSFVYVRIQVIKGRCAICVSAYWSDLYSVVVTHTQSYFDCYLIKQLFIKSPVRRTD